jgi:hypothetical protein
MVSTSESECAWKTEENHENLLQKSNWLFVENQTGALQLGGSPYSHSVAYLTKIQV